MKTAVFLSIFGMFFMCYLITAFPIDEEFGEEEEEGLQPEDDEEKGDDTELELANGNHDEHEDFISIDDYDPNHPTKDENNPNPDNDGWGIGDVEETGDSDKQGDESIDKENDEGMEPAEEEERRRRYSEDTDDNHEFDQELDGGGWQDHDETETAEHWEHGDDETNNQGIRYDFGEENDFDPTFGSTLSRLSNHYEDEDEKEHEGHDNEPGNNEHGEEHEGHGQEDDEHGHEN